MIAEPPIETKTTTEPAFYLSKDNEVFGPYSIPQLQHFLDTAVFLPEHFVWQEGMESWLPIQQAFGFAPAEEPTELAETEDSLPVDEASAPVIEDWEVDPDAQVARMRTDGLPRRFSFSVGTALFFHLGLLVGIVWAAPSLFKVVLDPPPVTAKEPPPLEVVLVPEEEPPPPPPPVAAPEPPPVAPPPVDEPPPPAVPDVPLAAPPPVVSQPVPPNLPPPPPPVLDTPPPPSMPAPPKIKRVVVAPRPSLPPPPSVADAGPSDYVYAPVPSYPPEAKRMRQEGTVVLLMTVNAAGDTVGVRVAQSSGFRALDEEALRNAKDYRFTEGRSRLLRVPIAFQMVH